MLESQIAPDRPEMHSAEARDGTISGFIPAKITAIESTEDPEKLGRVKVQCDLFSESQGLPASYDGWVFVGVPFTNTGSTGGAHPPLVEGNQVALLPMLGNPTQLLLICSIHSRNDRPNELFDRAKGVSGTQTAGGVFDFINDEEASRQQIYPHGVAKVVGKDGSISDRTAGGGQFRMDADGGAALTNRLASQRLGADGEIVTKSEKGDVSLKLGADGTALMQSNRFGSAIEMSSGKSTITGPAPPIFGLLKDLKESVLGKVGKAQGAVSELSGLFASIGKGNGTGVELALDKGLELMKGLSGDFGQIVSQGQGVLSSIQKFDVGQLGDYLMPQVTMAIEHGIGNISPLLVDAIKQGIPEVKALLKQQNLPALSQPDQGVLEALMANQPGQAAQFVLSKVVPGGYESFANLAALGLHDKVGPINQLINEGNKIGELLKGNPLTTLTQGGAGGVLATAEAQALSQITKYGQQLTGLIPKDIRGFLDSSGILGSITSAWKSGGKVDFGGVMKNLLGTTAQGFVSQALKGFLGTSPYAAALPIAQSLIGSLLKGEKIDLGKIAGQFLKIPEIPGLGNVKELIGNPLKFASSALGSITKGLGGLFGRKTKALNKVVGAIPKVSGLAKVEVNALSAGLSAAGGASRVFANAGGAGLFGPKGGFAFNAKGGSLIGDLAMKVMNPDGSKGSSLNVDKDGVSLVGLAKDGVSQLSRIEAVGDKIDMTVGRNRISIDSNAVYINGIDVSVLERWALTLGRIDAIELRLSQIPI